MNILVINAGSSSLKYQLIDMDNEKLLAKGLVGAHRLYRLRRGQLLSEGRREEGFAA